MNAVAMLFLLGTVLEPTQRLRFKNAVLPEGLFFENTSVWIKVEATVNDDHINETIW